MKRNGSPCIDICHFSRKSGWCKGCGRTREEAKKWRSIKPFAKNAKIINIGMIKIKFSSFSIKIFLIAGSKRYAIAEVDPATINEKIPERIIFPI